MVGWKAWYLINGKLETFTSDKTKWEELPQEGIMWLNRYWHHYERIQNEYITEGISGQDFWVRDNCMMRELQKEAPPELKFGQMVSSQEWGKINKICRADKKIVKEML